MSRLTDGPLKDGLSIDRRDLARAANMSVPATRKALRELEEKGFIRNLTPELPIERAVVRLTMFPFQGHKATHDYLQYKPTLEERERLDWLDKHETKLKALRRRTRWGRR